MKIALAGNPNSGKTSLFNALTGSTEKVGNWAGVTVAKKEGVLKKDFSREGEGLRIVDLPGAYSMNPYSSEETVTRDFILGEKPDVLIHVVDATNLNRSLLLTTQLLELGIPLLVALNKSDMMAKHGITIQADRLADLLSCPVVPISASLETNLQALVDQALGLAGHQQKAPFTSSLFKDGISKDKIRKEEGDRLAFVNDVTQQVETRTRDSAAQNRQDAVDRIVAHKFWGIPIFAAVIYVAFAISQQTVGPAIADYLVGWIDAFYGFVEGNLSADVSPVLSALLLDGIIGGVGAVLGFLPLIMVLFFLLALLEDSGYMARVAVVMDRFFKKVGLSGRSIIPMIIGTGCAIPGIMATRTIRDDRQRRTTAMLTPLMPCGAKLPVIALFAGVFFAEAAWVGTLMYFLGIAIIILGALIIKQITAEETAPSYFIMELPEYTLPSLKRAFFSMMSRAKAFIIKAGTIILVCNAAVHMMQTFNWNFEVVEEGMEGTSILASLAGPFAIILVPLGFGIWQFAAASITGFIAKENVIGTLAVVFSISNFIDTEEFELISGTSEVAAAMGLTSVAALSFLVFTLFTPPCFAAVGAMNAEMGSKKWLFAGIGFQLGMGYTVSYLVYQVGTLMTTGSLGTAPILGFLIVAAFIGVLVYLISRHKKEDLQGLKEMA